MEISKTVKKSKINQYEIKDKKTNDWGIVNCNKGCAEAN
jgi:hypothetical protein